MKDQKNIIKKYNNWKRFGKNGDIVEALVDKKVFKIKIEEFINKNEAKIIVLNDPPKNDNNNISFLDIINTKEGKDITIKRLKDGQIAVYELNNVVPVVIPFDNKNPTICFSKIVLKRF